MQLAATYARVSTARQEQEQTIKSQMLAINTLIAERGFKVVAEYADEGWTGEILARPELDRLRQDAKAKLWDVLVVYDSDRISRRYAHQEQVFDELREVGIEVVCVTISPPKNAEEKILYGVRGLFAEYERSKITERFRLGKLRKVKEGHILVSEPLYGYHYVPKEEQVHGYYEINEAEARIVRMIFSWVDGDGMTLRALVRKLQEQGIRPRKSKRGVWATSTLSHLLRNKAYIGEARWGSSYAVVPTKPKKFEKYRKIKKSSRRVKPEEEWLTIPVPTIIDRDVFARVQKRLKANFLLSQRNTKNEYLLAGKIYCPCGRKRGGEGPQNGKFLYYRCLDRVLSFPLPHACKEKAINARIADQLVWNGVVELMSSPELMQNQIHRWMKGQHDQIDFNKSDTRLIKQEIDKLKVQVERYNKAYGSGLFTLEQLKEYTGPVREKAAGLEAQLSRANQEAQDLQVAPLPDEKAVADFAKEASKVLHNVSFATKKDIIMSVLEKAVGTNNGLQVYGFIPVKNINVFTNDWHRQNTPPQNIFRSAASLLDGSAKPKQIPFYLELVIQPL